MKHAFKSVVAALTCSLALRSGHLMTGSDLLVEGGYNAI